MTPLRLLLLLSLLLLPLRLYAATRVGFGDAEALYVVYGLHPQPIYLDHPGLVGVVARLVGQGGAPSPLTLHVITSIAATLVPWLGVGSARLLGASPEQAPKAGLALLAAPEITVGLFALTPDLLLAPLWLLGAGLFGLGLRSPPRSAAALGGFLGAGACVGLGLAAKAPAALLGLAMAASLLLHHRASLRGPGPWLGAAMAALLAAPVVAAEIGAGFPMVHHRLVATQHEAGLSLRNLGALLGGQLAYLSPLVAVAAVRVALALRGQKPSPAVRWLQALTLVSALPLAALCFWSRVAEPHWMAPAWLSLALGLALLPDAVSARLGRWALGTGLGASLLVHAWTLTDLAPRYLGRAYEPRYDLANDLYAWGAAAPELRWAVTLARQLSPSPVVVTPHWTIAAQVEATLGGRVRATTVAPIPDDFQRWTPPSSWTSAPVWLWVSDDRFGLELPAPLLGASPLIDRRITLHRSSLPTRTLRVFLAAPAAQGRASAPACSPSAPRRTCSPSAPPGARGDASPQR